MKKSLLIVAVLGLFVIAGVLVPAGVSAQEDDKVIKTTTDSRGFEKQHTEVDLIYQTAKELMAAKQYEKAAVELEKVIDADISRLDALHDLGTCYSDLKQFDKAAVAYAKVVAAHPGDERLLTNLAYYQMRSKDIDGAVKTYDGLLAIDPKNYEANRWLGYIAEKKKEPEKALGYYQTALETNPNDVNAMGSVAKIYGEMGQDDKSLEMYEQAIAAATGEEAHNLKSQLGKMYIQRQNFDKSSVLFADLVRDYPDKASYRYNLGISYNQTKRYADAAPELAKAIEMKPDFCAAYGQLAVAYNELKQPGSAMKTVESGLGACESGKNGQLYYEWGRALEGQARYEEAITKFQQIVSDPTWGTHAKKQIKRQQDLIKRAEAIKERQGY